MTPPYKTACHLFKQILFTTCKEQTHWETEAVYIQLMLIPFCNKRLAHLRQTLGFTKYKEFNRQLEDRDMVYFQFIDAYFLTIDWELPATLKKTLMYNYI